MNSDNSPCETDRENYYHRADLLCGCAAKRFFPAPAFFESPEYTLDEAIALVNKKVEGRVLRAETLKNEERTVYRIRILTPAGDVKTIDVDADKGITE